MFTKDVSLPLLQELNLCLRTKTLMIQGSVDEELTEKVYRALIRAEGQSLLISINSRGGDLDQGLAIADLIKHQCPNATTVALGNCHSAAMDILQAGSTRLAYPSASLMVHEGEAIPQSRKSVKEHVRELELIARTLYIPRLKISETEFIKLLSKDTYLTSTKALELGFIDAIVGAK